jgi:hypothetical protein
MTKWETLLYANRNQKYRINGRDIKAKKLS